MALEFNVTAADKFFLGEDKIIDFTIFDAGGIVPLNVAGFSLEWSLKKTDKAGDPGILVKTVGSGLSIVGVWNAVPATNTQRVRLTFASIETDLLKAGVAYRHSLKRTDVGNEGILSFGSFTFLQATVH